MSILKCKKERMVAKLVERYGAKAVQIRSQYHIQVAANPKGWHDIWFNQWGEKKVRLAGKRTIYPNVSVKTILNILAEYTAARTDIEAMYVAKDIGISLHRVANLSELDDLKEAYYADAGWRNGIARIAVVHIVEGGKQINAKVRTYESTGSNEAEFQAVDTAAAWRKDESIPIFTDAQGVAEKHPAPNVKWIPREKNRAADRLGNRRGREGSGPPGAWPTPAENEPGARETPDPREHGGK